MKLDKRKLKRLVRFIGSAQALASELELERDITVNLMLAKIAATLLLKPYHD